MDRILGTPKYGWTHIKLGEFECSGSYLTDIPVEWLGSIRNSLRSWTTLCLFADNEGTNSYIIINDVVSYAFKTTDNIDVITIWEYAENIIRQIVLDIESDFDAWIDWMCDDMTIEERSCRIEELIELLLEVKTEFKTRYKEEL